MMLSRHVPRQPSNRELACRCNRSVLREELRQIDSALHHGTGLAREPAQQPRRIDDFDVRPVPRSQPSDDLAQSIGLVGVVKQDGPPRSRQLEPVTDPKYAPMK